MEGDLSIGEVAQRAGVRASALRYYEGEGLIPPVTRRGGKRIYDESVFERLSLIELGKGAGFTIVEIRMLLNGFDRRVPPGKRWRALAGGKLEEIEAQMERLRLMRRVLRAVRECTCPTFEDCAEALRARR
jgi:MerR family redox-sensitive transcriptional activator SoxR